MSQPGSEETRPFAHGPAGPDQTHVQSTLTGDALAAAFPADPAAHPAVPRCRIVGVLGRGGMGIVYKAEQPELHRTVAVKTILAGIAGRPMVVARFLAEAEAMAAVRHPHVAEVFEFGKADGTPYLVMEFLPGGTLADRLAACKTLPPADAVRLVEKLARAVAAAHGQQIVHRDLKPSNVMFDAAGEPKVTDFGLAKRADSNLTVTDLQMGTPYYMAPEQAGGPAKFVGPPADVWALGVILFEVLTGRRPFEGDTGPTVVHQVVHADAPPLRQVAAGLPRDLETVVGKCLAKEPHLRYATAADLADDLRRWLDNKPILARQTSPTERLVLWARRKPMHALAWLLIPLVLVLGGFGLTVFRLWQTAERANATVTQAKEQLAVFARIRERTLKPRPGWTWDTREDLAAFGKLNPDADTVADLRTDAVAAWAGLDFREVDPLTVGFPVGSIAASPDRRWVAVGEFKPAGFVMRMGVHLFDATTGRKVRTVRFWPGVVVSLKGVSQDILLHLAFSQDGDTLFAGTRTGRLVCWNLKVATDSPADTAEAGREVTSLAATPDGKTAFAFTKNGGRLLRWDVGSKPKAVSADHPCGAVAVRPTTGELFAGLGSELGVRDAATLAATGPGVPFPGLGLHRLAFHPAGGWLAVGAGHTLRIVDAATRRPTMAFIDPALKTAAHRGSVEHVALHPTGAVVASLSHDADDHTLKVWSVSSGKLVGSAAIPGEGLLSLALSADGRTIYVGSSERTHRFELRGLDLLTREVPAAGFVEGVTFLPAGGVAAVSRLPTDDAGRLSLVRGGKATDCPLPPLPRGDGRWGVAAAGDRIAVTADRSDVVVWTAGEPRTLPIASASLPRFQPDGERLWVVADGHEHRPWNLATRAAEGGWTNVLDKHLKGAAGIQAAAVGRSRLVAGTRDGTIVTVDAAGTVQDRSPARHGPVTSIALSRDESLAVAGLYSGTVRTRHLADYTEDEAFAPHRDTVTAVALCDAAGGRLLATGSGDRSVRLFVRDGSGWRPLFALNDLGGAVNGLEFSPDGGRLLFSCAASLGYRVLDLDALHAELAKDGFGWR